ncbi:sperm acrosome membrane-associated protein 6 isoform X5 [Prionailurus iriomotensis]
MEQEKVPLCVGCTGRIRASAPPLTWAVQREVAGLGVTPVAEETPGDILEPCGTEACTWSPSAFPSQGPFGQLKGSYWPPSDPTPTQVSIPTTSLLPQF